MKHLFTTQEEVVKTTSVVINPAVLAVTVLLLFVM